MKRREKPRSDVNTKGDFGFAAVKPSQAKLLEEDRFLLKFTNELEVLKREVGQGIPYWKLQRYGINA